MWYGEGVWENGSAVEADASRIRVLPETVANQIAAGEVVERPANVVKELVENSLDAGARQIRVTYRHAGKTFIEVSDDGEGMSRDDALLALERHATSKLRATNDLHSLHSFGFRGEALPSIASVSRFTLRTRRRESAEGTEVLVNGGKLLHCRACGCPPGTTITVAHLFAAVPARRRFLKSDRTEAAHLLQTVRLLALAHPKVAFTVGESQRTLFRVTAGEGAAQRLRLLWSPEQIRALRPLRAEDPQAALKLRGRISPPGQGRPTRADILTFVNGRPVESRALTMALLEACHGRVPSGRYPQAILYLEIDPDRIDVNIHPTKRELRFRDEGLVRRTLQRAVAEALAAASPGTGSNPAAPPHAGRDTREATEAPSPDGAAPPWKAVWTEGDPPARAAERVAPTPWASRPRCAATADPSARPARTTPAPSARTTSTTGHHAMSSSAAPAPAPPAETPSSAPPGPGPQPERWVLPWSWVGAVRGTWALFTSEDGVVLLHPFRARWRVETARLEAGTVGPERAVQPLLVPAPLSLDAASAALLEDEEPALRSLGFTVAPFGRHYYRLEAAPSVLEPEDALAWVRDWLDQRRSGENGIPLREAVIRRQAWARARTGTASPDDAPAMAALARALLATAEPGTDPQGRPTYRLLDARQLTRWFGGEGESLPSGPESP